MDKRMQEYARLAVRIGANVQKDDILMLNSPVDCAEFARMITEEAYAAGARNVIVKWSDDAVGRLKYQHAADDVFDVFPEWETLEYNTLAADQRFARIAIYAEDPEALAGIDPDRIRRASAARNKGLKEFPYRYCPGQGKCSQGWKMRRPWKLCGMRSMRPCGSTAAAMPWKNGSSIHRN